MKRPAFFHVIIFVLLLSGLRVKAGEQNLVESKETAATKLSEPWEFNVGIPGWIAGVSGQIGLHNKTSNVDVDAGAILQHLSFTTSFCAEARKGPFGAYMDFLYLSDQAGTFTRGLVSKVDLRVDEYLADFDLNWRVIERPWGWVNVRAGVRYTNLYNRLGLQPNDSNIEVASARYVEASSIVVKKLLEKDLHGVLDGKAPILPLPPLAGDLQKKLLKLILKAKQDPALTAALLAGDPAQIAQAKRKVQNEITGILEKNLNRAFPLSEDWADPYLGLEGRYNLSKIFYLTAKADAGGFGVGSKSTWQAYGALGCHLSRSFYAEAGYRYLYVDYQHSGFVYDVSTQGPQITAGIVF